ncbi:MAG: radical SAM protein [Anaerovoracaceae bacterium]|jgi:MoaA/NifB/PqqE/SkfB family radical SAM enzyme
MKTVKEKIATKGLDIALNYLDQDIEKNMPKLMDWVDRFDINNSVKVERDAVRKVALDPESVWNRFLLNVWNEVDRDIVKKFFTNFLVYSNIMGNHKRKELKKKYECNIPWAILLDPTSSCNLHCLGCWASEYGDKMNLDLDTLDSIIVQGKELGTYMYIFSGGEPLVRKDDIIKLCEKHDDCQFLAFTNGTLIDEAFADEMLRVKNFIPAISIEGFEEETDFRRGKGTYQAILKAMKILKERKLPFGASCCYTSKNTEVIGSEEFFDSLLDMGCLFVWLFTYMPVGVDAVTELIASAEQREFMYHQVRKFRKTKPIFSMDFWNDGEFVGGCIAGGRNYLHINANGDIEPCAFIHYADRNIHSSTLLEAYQAPLFQAYRKNQPFNCNHLRPCPLLDNPEKIGELVEESGAKSTDFKNPEDVRDLSAKCVEQAEAWAITSEKLWKESLRSKGQC